MASHRGAVGLIAPKAKSASVGGIPALAVAAVLLLGGCGGGGGESSSTTAVEQGSSASAEAQAKAGDPAGSGSSQSAEAAQGPGASSQGSQDGGAPAAKHGSRIEIPEGAPEHAPTAAEKEELTIADITLSSPAVPASGALPAAYTCDGENSWPELHWRGVPKGTKELALFAMSVQPVEGKLFFDWAVAGLEPSLERIEAGRLPKGAVVGTNSLGKRGYEICPEGSETYVFALFALPERLSPRPGFDARTLRDEALGVSGNVGLLAVGYGG